MGWKAVVQRSEAIRGWESGGGNGGRQWCYGTLPAWVLKEELEEYVIQIGNFLPRQLRAVIPVFKKSELWRRVEVQVVKIKCLEFGSVSLVHRLMDYPKSRWKEKLINGPEVKGICENVVSIHRRLKQIKSSSHFMKIMKRKPTILHSL